jgi:hypothetical protein
MDDRDAGVAEMIRVTRPGGVLAACVWDSTTMPLLRAFWDAALDVAPERVGAIDDGRRVGYGHHGDLAELWEAHIGATARSMENLGGRSHERRSVSADPLELESPGGLGTPLGTLGDFRTPSRSPATSAGTKKRADFQGFFDGETRTRTGDTTIFRQAAVPLESQGTPCIETDHAPVADARKYGDCIRLRVVWATDAWSWPNGSGRRLAMKRPGARLSTQVTVVAGDGGAVLTDRTFAGRAPPSRARSVVAASAAPTAPAVESVAWCSASQRRKLLRAARSLLTVPSTGERARDRA